VKRPHRAAHKRAAPVAPNLLLVAGTIISPRPQDLDGQRTRAMTAYRTTPPGPLYQFTVTVTFLGPFTINLDGKGAGPWPRPSAKRLCELLMLASHRRLAKEVVREMLFPNLAPDASANALRKALSMARRAMLPLGGVGPRLVRADREQISVPSEIPTEIDLVTHQNALRCALAMDPGRARDAAL
jgi:hypothetical protein